MNGMLPPLDYTLLVAGTLLIFAALHRWLWRGRLHGALPLLIWVLVFTVLGSGWFFTEDLVRREQARMQQMMAGYAPTYAQEIGLMGHQEITLETSPDDPRYWRMIKAEQRWLAANPAISDIYTLRKLPDGHLARIVDWKADARQSAKIGEIYGGELLPYMARSLAGKSAFTPEPYVSRAGTAVSAFAPIRNFRGDVEAALGVDFDAAAWVATITRLRFTTMGYLAALLFIVAGGTGLLAHQNAARRLQTQLSEQEAMHGETETRNARQLHRRHRLGSRCAYLRFHLCQPAVRAPARLPAKRLADGKGL